MNPEYPGPVDGAPVRNVTMDYSTALKAVVNGHKVRRPEWTNNIYLFLEDGIIKVFGMPGGTSPFVTSDQDINAMNWTFTEDDVA